MDGCTNLESVLQKVNNFITLKQQDRNAYTEDFNRIRDFLLHEMKEIDESFGKLYNGPCLAGSYADNLKVSKPDEFDLVIHIKGPDQKLIDVRKDPQRPGNVLINLKPLLTKIEKEEHNKSLYAQLCKLMNENGYLVQNKFQSWIESLVTKVLEKCSKIYKYKNEVYKLDYAKTGPAHTINVTQGSRNFSIDFVPGIIFDKEKWPGKRKYPVYARYTKWIAVPKPVKARPDNISFQASFVDTEREIIQDKQNLKNCIRMFKKLRDRHNTQNLKSYYIKTVFLWETDVQPETFWSENSLTFIFLHMFQKIVGALESQKLLFFWDKSCNMFSGFTKSQLETMFGQWNAAFQKCLKFKDSEPAQIFKIFLTNEEIQHMNIPIKEANEKSVKKVNEQTNEGDKKVNAQSIKQVNGQSVKENTQQPTKKLNSTVQSVKNVNEQPKKVNVQPVKQTNGQTVKGMQQQPIKKGNTVVQSVKKVNEPPNKVSEKVNAQLVKQTNAPVNKMQQQPSKTINVKPVEKNNAQLFRQAGEKPNGDVNAQPMIQIQVNMEPIENYIEESIKKAEENRNCTIS